MKFDKYNISDLIKENLKSNGYVRPTDIQFKSIPSIMSNEDVLAIAQTGTGKTAAFAIPLIDRIHRTKSSNRSTGIRAIVMVPTRELAAQIGKVFGQLSKHSKTNIFALFGGVEQDSQINRLENGIDILIATPGRMFDLIKQEVIDVKKVETLVIDEADQMLKYGFEKDIDYIKMMLPKKHQTLFFSATIDDEIKKLAYSQVKSNAIRIQLSPEDPVSKNVTHFKMFVEMDDKRFFLERFINDHTEDKLVVFVRTRVRAERVVKAMERVGITAEAIHGEKDQIERIKVLNRFRENEFKILVATDVTARGIDIPDVTYVINYDLPEKPENYVHRVGRTGRGFNKGSALSFVSTEEKGALAEIQKLLPKPIDEIRLSKDEYELVVEQVAPLSSLTTLLNQYEIMENRKKKQSKGKKK